MVSQKWKCEGHPKYLAEIWIDFNGLSKGESAELHVEIWNRDGTPMTDQEMTAPAYIAFRNFLHIDGQKKFNKAYIEVMKKLEG